MKWELITGEGPARIERPPCHRRDTLQLDACPRAVVLMKVDAFNGETRDRIRRLRASFRLYD